MPVKTHFHNLFRARFAQRQVGSTLNDSEQGRGHWVGSWESGVGSRGSGPEIRISRLEIRNSRARNRISIFELRVSNFEFRISKEEFLGPPRPAAREPRRTARRLRARGILDALVQAHENVRAQRQLNLHGALRRERMQ